MNPPPLLPWSLLFWETLFLGAASVLGAFILFSFLPISTAVIVGGLNLLSFSDLRDRLNPSLHMVGVAALWLALNLVLYALIFWVGRAPFEWMLGIGTCLPTHPGFNPSRHAKPPPLPYPDSSFVSMRSP